MMPKDIKEEKFGSFDFFPYICIHNQNVYLMLKILIGVAVGTFFSENIKSGIHWAVDEAKKLIDIIKRIFPKRDA